MKTLSIFFLFYLLAAPGWAFEVPPFTPNVVDTTATLSETQKQQLNQKILSVREQSKIFAAILIIPTLDGESIEAAAIKTFEQWKLGAEKADNGLLFLVSLNDHKMRIEVGYGLEGSIPDIKAKEIIDHILKPKFKKNNYFEGLDLALTASNELVLNGDSITLENEGKFFSPLVIRLGQIWLFIIFGIPYLIRLIAVNRARTYEVKLQPTPEEESPLRLIFLSGISFFISLFLTVNPGIFFVTLFKEGELAFLPFIMIFPLVFLGAVNSGYIMMLKPNWREKFLKNWLNQPNQANGAAPSARPQAFVGSLNSRGSRGGSSGFGSSSSSGGSSRSSSGGGRSGGGGASGSW